MSYPAEEAFKAMIISAKNQRLMHTIYHQPVDATPIWIMRQAGRYLPEYRAIREQAGSFMQLCKTPTLACEVTLQPLRRFALDASIIFSDILTIPDAMGLGLEFKQGEGPFFHRPIKTARDIERLAPPDPELSLGYVLEAIRLVKQELAGRIPLIGFCGSPWTLAAYMVQGKSVPHFPRLRQMQQEEPLWLHRLLTTLMQAVTLHLSAQINAGVDAVMLFDTWGGMLNTTDYATFSLVYMRQIVDGLKRHHPNKKCPIILFTKHGSQWIKQIADTGCEVISLDWTLTLAEARTQLDQHRIALQGNLNPDVLRQSPKVIREEVAKVLASYGRGSGHIFNLGHGITPDIPPEHVSILVDAVHELSQPYHQEEK